MPKQSKSYRIMSIALTSRGFGYAVLEGENLLVDFGKKDIHENKNARSMAQIEKLIMRYAPGALILDDINAKEARRGARIKKLHREVVVLAKKCKLPVTKISGVELRSTLIGNVSATKHEIAEFLVSKFPDELIRRLPPKRQLWKSADIRMDIFDAVGLVVASKK